MRGAGEVTRVTYKGKPLDPVTVETLEFARVHLLSFGGRLLIERVGSNRDGDRHRLTVRLAYIEHAEVRILGLSYPITQTGWMAAGRGDRHTVVFGGGGTSPVVGTLELVGLILGIRDPQTMIRWSEL